MPRHRSHHGADYEEEDAQNEHQYDENDEVPENEEEGSENGEEVPDDEDEEELDNEEEAEQEDDGKPRTYDADNEELYEGGQVFLKSLVAQTYNADTGPEVPDLDHEDNVQSDVLEEDEDGDWRIVQLMTVDHDGEPYQLTAKMDSGADKNLINEEIVRLHHIDYDALEGPELPQKFTVGSGASVSMDGIARISYTANGKWYTEEFYVQENLPHDVILGMPFLQHSHAITINPEFAHPDNKDPDFLLFETKPVDGTKEAELEAARKQKQAERDATYAARTGRS